MLKQALFIALAAAAYLVPQAATAQVGVSINIGQPNYYGRIRIGDYPQPQLIFPEPVLIKRSTVSRSPIYLRVPPGHAKNWGKHCSRYGACGRPVYFVDDGWYESVYAPAYRERHGRSLKGHGNDRSLKDNDRHDNDHHRGDKGHDKGGHGKNKGKGKGHD